jgi:hypothetical protein
MTNSTAKYPFIPESAEGRVVNITWTDDDEFKMFGKYKWKNGETKTIKTEEWWVVRNDVHGRSTLYNSSHGSDNSNSFTTENGITVRVQMNNDYLQVGEKVGIEEYAPVPEKIYYCYGT